MEQLEDPKPDDNFLLALAGSYKNRHRNQIQDATLVAGKISHVHLSKYIPAVTRYQYTAARKYSLEVGADFTVD